MKKIGIFAFAVAMLAAPTLVSAQSWGASSVQTPAWGSTPVIDSCMALGICANQPPAPRVNCSSAMTNCMTAQEIRQEARREARREAVREARRAERRASR